MSPFFVKRILYFETWINLPLQRTCGASRVQCHVFDVGQCLRHRTTSLQTHRHKSNKTAYLLRNVTTGPAYNIHLSSCSSCNVLCSVSQRASNRDKAFACYREETRRTTRDAPGGVYRCLGWTGSNNRPVDRNHRDRSVFSPERGGILVTLSVVSEPRKIIHRVIPRLFLGGGGPDTEVRKYGNL